VDHIRFSNIYKYLSTSLKVRTLLSFQCVVIVGGLIALTLGILLYNRTILQQAQDKVQIDLNAARMVFNQEIKYIETIVSLTTERFFLKEELSKGQCEQAKNELERIRMKYGMDFLALTDSEGRVLLRTRNAYVNNDNQSDDEMICEAMRGNTVSGAQIIPQEELSKEGDDLAAQAVMPVVPTIKAKPRASDRETSGMVLKAAVPVVGEEGNLLGVLYGGKLLNRNYALVDRIKSTVFGEVQYRGKEIGTATIFQWDQRISTNVRIEDGNRAIGTCVSSEVYEKVLEDGLNFIGRAFVVNALYITAYEPIRNVKGEIIGMLYVGTLEQPFVDIRNRIIYAFMGIALVGVLVSFALSVFLTRSITQPIEKLLQATRDISKGQFPSEISIRSRDEIGHLASSFNQMSNDLRHTMLEKDAINKRLKDLNSRYLGLLGFTTHELKQPIEVLNGYLIMLQQESIGKLTTDLQREAISDMRANVSLMTDMIQKYLQLSQIESGELSVSVKETHIYSEIIQPILKGEQQLIDMRKMRLAYENREAIETVVLSVDPTLIRIVFSNLIDNAIKYGQKEGTITIGYQGDNGFHRFHVKNDGRGIPQPHLKGIFKKFARINEGNTARVTGTGLGLYNTKEIIKKHGGKIWAESEEGKWADFIFLIPKAH